MDPFVVAHDLHVALIRAFTLMERFRVTAPEPAKLVARNALVASEVMKAYWRGRWNTSEITRAYNTTLALDAAIVTMLIAAGVNP